MERYPRPARRGGAPSGARDRYYQTAAASSNEGARSLLSAFLALSVFLLVLALSVWQATQPGPAGRALEVGIASITDIDLLLAEQGPALKRQADAGSAPAYALPGYPIDAYLSRDEALTLQAPQQRELLLQRSAAIVYHRGLQAFDRTGHQSLSTFSVQGMLDLVVGRLTDSTSERAGIAAVLLTLLTGALAVGVVARGQGYVRLRALGTAVLVGAVPGLLMFLGLRFLVGRIGGDGPFVSDVRTIFRTILDVPVRNYLVVSFLGVAIAVLSPVMAVADRWPDKRPMRGEPAPASETDLATTTADTDSDFSTEA